MRVLVFDTETTGLSKSKIISPSTLHLWPHIVQFSYVIYDTEIMHITDVFDNIVKMKENVIIPADSIDIHNITNEDSAKRGIPIEDVLSEFFYYLQTADIIVGHNISFDTDMVKVELLRLIYNTNLTKEEKTIFKNNLHLITHFKNIYCTMKSSVDLCKIPTVDKFGKSYFKYPKLIELHTFLFGTEAKYLHNSLYDILVTLRCYVKINLEKDILDAKDEKYNYIYEKVFA
jgi:DNA polymerase III epsilon subunit-like protein